MKRFLSFGISAILVIALLTVMAFAQKRGIQPLNKSAQSASRSLNGRSNGAATTGGTAAAGVLNYHGGLLINTPTVYLIWYGNWNSTNGSDTPAGQQIVRDFVSNLGGSPHFQLNTSLSVVGQPISGNVVYGGQTTDTGTRTSLSDAQITTIISNAISSGRLPYNADGIYVLMTASTVTASSGFCTQYCGFHGNATLTSRNVRYSYVGNAKRCLSGCAVQSTVSPNGNPGIDGTLSVLAHEIEEATTDPDSNPAGWFSNATGQENGDECAYTFGHFQYQVANGSFANMHLGTRDYLIQRNILKSGSSFFCMVDSTHN